MPSTGPSRCHTAKRIIKRGLNQAPTERRQRKRKQKAHARQKPRPPRRHLTCKPPPGNSMASNNENSPTKPKIARETEHLSSEGLSCKAQALRTNQHGPANTNYMALVAGWTTGSPA
ncbi:Hypothetical predicted protein [Pelobates cultripes]|uniref:Uncharacterized protein n=1 Tax=Pelobates cultripes TaxID=61616 RepID=A0AAD1SRT7_PELCU|nr:Hypothetical predicted protein [Pelobates cultripes]